MTEKYTYRYHLYSLKNIDMPYGPCEVCGGIAPELYVQIEEVQYTHPDGSLRWSRYGCQTLAGHKECLIGRRK